MLAIVFLVQASCGGSSGLGVFLDEYSIELEAESSPAGDVVLAVRNDGAITHQLIVLRIESEEKELRVEDGLAQIDAEGVEELARIDLIPAGAERSLEVDDLQEGRHLLICNIAGHYANGMRARLRVG